jgi:hypothetical protein
MTHANYNTDLNSMTRLSLVLCVVGIVVGVVDAWAP